MISSISRAFFRGIMIVVPIAVTVYLLSQLWSYGESMLGPLLQRILPNKWYQGGMGVAALILLILLCGALFNFWFFRRFFRFIERTFDHLPLVKTVYGAVRDLLGMFSSGDSPGMSGVVIVTLGGARWLGMVTRENFADLPAGFGKPDFVAVYIPLSYNVGGYTVMVQRSAVEKVDMSVEDAMRYAITAGLPPKRLGTVVRRRPEGIVPPPPMAT
jgi:uncharacterized membrane protein